MAYPKRTPSENYLSFYLFSSFSLDLHHYNIFHGLLKVVSLPCDCKVYLCTVLNPHLAALHLRTSGSDRAQGPWWVPTTFCLGEGELGSLRPWALPSGPGGMEKLVKSLSQLHPLTLRKQFFPQGLWTLRPGSPGSPLCHWESWPNLVQLSPLLRIWRK